ncbi:DEKNAAC100224 [Brettanomyces naardenensis]|uniref:DEKNAAC100224 n=1 Tax=Brettanomyces naardenensis TaxID=13370 RepID=A0A448YG82_BRENA|nr:DEKNAAC100224 [Brettanomyces naardenensis]
MDSINNNNNDGETYDSGLDIDPEKTIPKPPRLERQICLEDSKSLSNFLKLSRVNVDDSIRTRINSVLNHHESRNKESILSFRRPDHATESPCLPLIKQLIFPQWYRRIYAINFCTEEVSKMALEVENDPQNNMSDEEKNRLLRVDPYAMRDIERKRIDKSDEVNVLTTKWENEKEVEGIIRNRSEEVLYDLCNLPDFNVKNEFLKYSRELGNGS